MKSWMKVSFSSYHLWYNITVDLYMTLVFQGGNLEIVHETLSIQCPS